mgnify:CR=1 FL=1
MRRSADTKDRAHGPNHTGDAEPAIQNHPEDDIYTTTNLNLLSTSTFWCKHHQLTLYTTQHTPTQPNINTPNSLFKDGC